MKKTGLQTFKATIKQTVKAAPRFILSATPYALMLTTLFLLADGSALAKSGESGLGEDYGDMPGAINIVLGFLRGPLAKIIALGGIVVGGMGLTFGESGGLRTAMLVMVGIGFIMAASAIVTTVAGMSVAL